MYEQHFGLKNRPFGANAEGARVFVGPQQTNVMTNLNKGLTAADAVVTVTGPAGVGKTTIVNRALESVCSGRLVAWVGRMQLAPDEVLELLLTGFGINRQTRGTIQRFAAFRRLLTERAAAGAQVTIVVEDAQRIGTDALLELEALTAADAGDATSANIILLGQGELNNLLAKPELARLRQRNRLRQKIEALSAAEVNGYLKHCIRESGGDYDRIFEDGVSNIVFKCSEGVPRVINTLCETAMTAAKDEKAPQVSVAIMQQVAADAFGYEERDTAHTVTIDDATAGDARWSRENIPVNAASTVDTGDSQDHASAPTSPAEDPGHVVPELINDTQPSMQQLDDSLLQNSAENEGDFPADTRLTSDPMVQAPAVEDLADSGDSDEVDPEIEFSLDAALSVEAEETNVMPGITPNLDQLAAAARKSDAALAAGTISSTDNIPTLSNSMRIDVAAEVGHAQRDETEEPNDAARSEAAASGSIGTVANNAAAPEDAADNFIAEPKPVSAASVSDTKTCKQDSTGENAKDHSRAETQQAAEKLPAQPDEPVPTGITATKAADGDAMPGKPVASLVSAQPETEPDPVEAPVPEPAVNAPLAPEAEPLRPVASERPTAAPEEIAPADDADAAAGAHAHSTSNGNADDAWTSVGNDPLDDDAHVDEVQSASEPKALFDDIALADLPAEKPAEGMQVTHPATALPANTVSKKRTPDIDALEAALDAAKNGEFATSPTDSPASKPENATELSPGIPEITLDDSLPKENPDHDELRKVAEQIGAANSLEDITDVMAETIFGSQALDEIAAAVVANPPSDEPLSPVMLEEAELPTATDALKSGNGESETHRPATPAKLDEAAAQRLDMVKALNNGGNVNLPVAEEIEIGSDTPPSVPVVRKPTGPQPEPIENQINTSMTQTLKALSSAQVRKADAAAADEKKSAGLFSRFRKSS